MISQQLDLSQTGKFSSLFLDYLAGKDQLSEFIGNRPEIEHFQSQIDEKASFPSSYRQVLVETLTAQYNKLKEVPEAVAENISLLEQENTFTITTGHQLNLCTGPLYVIYKLVTIIRACQELKKAYPAYNFVPVYWMASEDHDFEEIDHFNFNGQTYRWETGQSGAVGRFSLDDIGPFLTDLSAIPGLFHLAYSGKWKLADAVRHYMNDLFGMYGLVVLDPDNREQKSLFRSAMRAEILEHTFAPLVDQTTDQLKNLGYKTQINARQINFFYVEEQMRHRIEVDGDRYIVVDTDLSFSREEIEQLIDDRPECFSPNVVLRPLYQETVLPNLAYVGGPSELVYWMQLGGVFKSSDIPMPILMPRNFALVVPANVERKRQKTNLPVERFFNGIDSLISEVTLERSENQLSLEEQQEKINRIYDEISALAANIDSTLIANVDARKTNSQKSIRSIEKKFLRAEKRNNKILSDQIQDVHQSLFPKNGLQERYTNFLDFYQSDPAFIDELMSHFDPFSYRFNILTYGE